MNEGTLGVKDCERMQIQREVRCALNLAALLQRFLDGDEAAFRHALGEEVALLVAAAFGQELLHAIGWVYKNKAEQWLGFHDGSALSLEARSARLDQRLHTAANYLDTAGHLFDTLTAIKSVAEASGGKPPPQMQQSNGGGGVDAETHKKVKKPNM